MSSAIKPPKVKIKTGFTFAEQQYTVTEDDKKYIWYVNRLCEKARYLPAFDLPLAGINTYQLQPDIKNFNEWVSHIKKVRDADLLFPILLDDEGYVIDGRHRIAKAILEGHRTIKAVRFDVIPPYDIVKDV